MKPSKPDPHTKFRILPNDDTIFGTKARKKAGDSWPIDPTSASARLAKSEIKVNPVNITGTTTLVEVGERSLKLASAIAATGFDLSLPFSPAMKVTNSALNARLTGIFPIDLAKRVLYSAVNVDSKVEFAGKIGAKEVKIVATLKHAKDVTFTEL